jgi:hypothetical protein
MEDHHTGCSLVIGNSASFPSGFFTTTPSFSHFFQDGLQDNVHVIVGINLLLLMEIL